jgi:hypothetical protein
MAIKKNAPVQSLDMAVEAAIGGKDPIYDNMASRRQRARNQTPGQRRKAKKDSKRNKVTYDLPEELSDLINGIGKHFSIPVSQVAALLMLQGLSAMAKGQLNLRSFELRPSRSPRYDWVLEEMPETPQIDIEKL